LAGRIEAMGGRAICQPAVTIGVPDDWSAVDRALEQLAAYRWLVFTSSNGVDAFVRRLRQMGRDLRALGGLKLAVIGPATAEALRAYHLEADVMPDTFNSEGLAAALRDQVAGQRVLLARADRGVELLREELSAVTTVDQVAVYSQRDAQLDESEPALRMLSEGRIDFVTLTSSNIAWALIGALDGAAREQIRGGRTALVCISPRTSAAVRQLGLPVAAEAGEYTTEGVLAALCGLARKN
jgi:uroporphyrinogen III methyltransferase/synthase